MQNNQIHDLDAIYLKLLEFGLCAIRNAAAGRDSEYCMMEAEHIHNLPSLVGESNRHRHIYYATAERTAYLQWAIQCNRKSVRELITYWYASEWKKLDAILGIESPSEIDQIVHFEE